MNIINLCLVVNRKSLDPQDVGEIAKRVRARDANIMVNVASARDTADVVPRERWKQPSITVAFAGSAGSFVPPRGPVFESQPVPKIEQATRLSEAGVATPQTAKFNFGMEYPVDLWSEFVIVKPLPLAITSKSGQSKLYRGRRLAALRPIDLSPDHVLRNAPALVQQFIDTGLYPSKWRVLSFLGEPLYSSITRSAAPRAPLDAPDEEIEASIIDAKNPLSRTFDPDGKRNQLVRDDRILAFAREVHACFPRRPLLGIDILEREGDGKLFALEINAGGNCWHFSSAKEGHRQRLGGKEAMVAQLGAWDAAARALIRHARKYAV